jgi:hypothetical protein
VFPEIIYLVLAQEELQGLGDLKNCKHYKGKAIKSEGEQKHQVEVIRDVLEDKR